MLIIKIGGSIFAPKNSKELNLKYLKNLNIFLKKIYKGPIIIIHGTGNVGHGFVKKYGINSSTFPIFKKIRKNFFSQIDNIFNDYKRILADDFEKYKNKLLNPSTNFIISGDILSNNLKVISSDLLFGKLLQKKEAIKIILTDVNGVLNKKGEIIRKINLNNLNKITFWEKQNDVTNSMKGKLLAIQKYLPKHDKGVWLCNGFNLKNLENILKNDKGEGSLLYK